MHLFVILRRRGWKSPEELKAAAVRSGRVGDEMPDDVRWIRSYVLNEGAGSVGTVCIYGDGPRGDPQARTGRRHSGRRDSSPWPTR